MKRITIVVAAILVAAVAVPATSNASVKAVAKCGVGHAAKRPSNFYFYCGDNGMYATGLSWRSWGGKRAKGFGTITYKLCKPSCAAGGIRSKPGKITLYRKVRCESASTGTRDFEQKHLAAPLAKSAF